MKFLLTGAVTLLLAGCASVAPKNPTISILVDLDPASVDRTTIVESITADRNGMLYVADQMCIRDSFRRVPAPQPSEVDLALTDGRARAVLWIGPGFEHQLLAGGTVDVQVLVDGAFTAPARTIGGHLERCV